MKVINEIGKLIITATGQLSSRMNLWRWESDKRLYRFGNKFDSAAKKHGVSRNDAIHVYTNGKVYGPGKMINYYKDYEIGIFYDVSSVDRTIWINYIWKKDIYYTP